MTAEDLQSLLGLRPWKPDHLEFHWRPGSSTRVHPVRLSTSPSSIDPDAVKAVVQSGLTASPHPNPSDQHQ